MQEESRNYNALTRIPTPQDPICPRGILTFFQLNTLFEGIFNDALTPAVFFEQDDFMERFLAADEQQQARATGEAEPDPLDADARPEHLDDDVTKRATRVLRTVADVVDLLETNRDATEPEGKIVTLRHFLAVTSRESLHKLKWSVESIRRGLLDERMGILHRQSRLVQLRLEKAGDDERTPEIAVKANESQLRGYVMLVGAKLPLIANVHRFAAATAARIAPGRPPGGTDPSEDGNRRGAEDARDLRYRLDEWAGLLGALFDNIRGLENAVEHAWMERLLYEQEQARAEQEAMAEIERSRSSRPTSLHRGGGGTYNAMMLFFTIAAATAAVVTIAQYDPRGSLWERTVSLWRLVAVATLLSLVPIADRIRRYLKEARGEQDGYGYEFAFRLDRVVDTRRIEAYMAAASRARQRGDDATAEADGKEASSCPSLSQLHIDRQGGVRIEYVSRDSTLIKIHSVVRFRTRKPGRWFNPARWVRRTARFEIINEFLVRTVSGSAQYVLRESRMFGDAPRPLEPGEVRGLVTFALNRSALTFQKMDERRQPLTATELMSYTDAFFVPGAETEPVPPHELPKQRKHDMTLPSVEPGSGRDAPGRRLVVRATPTGQGS